MKKLNNTVKLSNILSNQIDKLFPDPKKKKVDPFKQRQAERVIFRNRLLCYRFPDDTAALVGELIALHFTISTLCERVSNLESELANHRDLTEGKL